MFELKIIEFFVFVTFSFLYVFFTFYFSLKIINYKREEELKIKDKNILIVSFLFAMSTVLFFTFKINEKSIDQKTYISTLEKECAKTYKKDFMIDNKISNYERLIIESKCGS